MKILFLNLPYEFQISRASRWPEKTKSGTLYYPYWLCYAAGVCIEKGYDVDVIDSIAEGDIVSSCIEKVKMVKPDYLVCEITTPTCVFDYKTISRIKAELPETIIIVGGTHATALDKKVMEECESIDIIARQEYDYTIDDIIKNVNNLSDVRGVTYRGLNGDIVRNEDRPWVTNLDEIPMVSKVYEKYLNVYNYGYSLAESPMVQIFSARGCPFQCNFCSYPATMGGRLYRARSVKNFVDELEYIVNKMPYIKEIFIEDDTFTVDKERVLDICEEIIARKIKVKWSCNTRATLPEEIMKAMKKAGCRLLVVGFESGNQNVLNETKKGITLSDSERLMESARRNKLKVFGCFMIGLKGDSLSTIDETYTFAKKINPDMVFFQQAVPFPGTGLYEWAKDEKMLITENYGEWLDEDGTLRCLIDYSYASHDKIKKIRNNMMSRYYFSVSYIFKTFLKNLKPAEFMRVSRAAVSYIKYRITSNDN